MEAYCNSSLIAAVACAEDSCLTDACTCVHMLGMTNSTQTTTIGGFVQRIETVDQWINRQPWPHEVQAEARQLVANRPAMCNPMTRGQWRSFAEDRGLSLAER